MATVEERVVDIVAEQLGVDKDKITRDTSFVNDLGADSLDTVELVMELEEEFDISIPDDAAEKIQRSAKRLHISKAPKAKTAEAVFRSSSRVCTSIRRDYSHCRPMAAALNSQSMKQCRAGDQCGIVRLSSRQNH